MWVTDELYGTFKLDEVLVELIKSEPVQRLKGVRQGGASYLVNPKWNVTRYDHSIGVMLLVKRLGGGLEEQIASLLHDISHTAFSHVIDFVFNNQKEDYHEVIYEQIVAKSMIPTILKQAGMDWKTILLDESQWTLMERGAPELCADRVDYTLRDMYTYGEISLVQAHRFLDQLTVRQGRMYCTRVTEAVWFVETYYKEVIGFFMNPLNMYGYDRLAFVLKRALDKELLSLEDFLKKDDELLDLLLSSEDRELIDELHKLSANVEIEETATDYDIHRKTKIRFIDPSVAIKGGIIPVSILSNQVQRMNEAAQAKAEKGVYLKVHLKEEDI